MNASPDAEKRPRAWLAGALALAAAAIVLLPTLRFGLGQTPDAVSYLSAAEGFAEGRGLVLYDGSPYADWPPLYPLLVAALVAVSGVSVATAAWILQGLLAAAIAVLVYVLLARLAPHSALAPIAGTTAAVVAPPFLAIAAFAWSELAFVAMVLAFFVVLDRVRERDDAVAIVGLTLLVGAVTLTRYVGIVLLPIGFLVVARKRPLAALGFAAGAVLPLALWTQRNFALVGAPLGRRRAEGTAIVDSLERIESTLAAWVLPGFDPWLWIGLPLLITSAAIAAVRLPRLRALAAFVLVYPSFLVWSAAHAPLDPLDDRLLSPLALPWLVLVATLIAAWPRRAAFALALLWIPFAMTVAFPQLMLRAEGGPGGYSTPQWRDLGLDRVLLALEREEALPVYSNAPDALWSLTGRRASFTPWRPANAGPAKPVPGRSWPSGHFYVVWFDRVDRRYLLALDDLRPLLALRPATRFGGGEIHRGQRVEMAAASTGPESHQ